MSDADRLDRLERAVDELRRELAAVRSDRAKSAPSARLSAWAARVGSATVPGSRAALEALVGRYGTVALAALLILMAVGAFLTWAVANFTVGPVTRVALGALGATVLAIAGWRVRARAEHEGVPGGRRFGDILLGLALAVVHVDAWGAGPYLGLVPQGMALAVAAAASSALAWLAWRERQQSLFVVGVGGALLAPFVTSAGPGHPFVLPAYGWLVLTSGALALPRDLAGGTRWSFAARLLALAGAGYTGAMLGDATSADASATMLFWPSIEAVRHDVPVLFPLASAAGALLVAGPLHGGRLTLAHLTTLLGALFALGVRVGAGERRLIAFAFIGTVMVYGALRLVAHSGTSPGGLSDRSQATAPGRLVIALGLPLGFVVTALAGLPHAESVSGAVIAASWAALAAVAAWLEHVSHDDSALGAYVAVAGLASALVPVLLLPSSEVARLIALAAHAMVFALVFGRSRRALAVLPPLVVLVGSTIAAAALLRARPAYGYTPFATLPSLTALALVLAWTALAWQACVTGPPGHTPGDALVLTGGERGTIVAAAPVVALLWGHEELARAFAPDVAMFLLVGYFAAAGIAAILVGRTWRLPAARQAGLALAMYAAVKALVQASTLETVGLRIGSYLLVGGFLLAVGYWYRAADGRALFQEREPAGGPRR